MFHSDQRRWDRTFVIFLAITPYIWCVQTLVQLPEIGQLQALIERLRNVGELLQVGISQPGDLTLSISTPQVAMGTQYSHLRVWGERGIFHNLLIYFLFLSQSFASHAWLPDRLSECMWKEDIRQFMKVSSIVLTMDVLVDAANYPRRYTICSTSISEIDFVQRIQWKRITPSARLLDCKKPLSAVRHHLW